MCLFGTQTRKVPPVQRIIWFYASRRAGLKKCVFDLRKFVFGTQTRNIHPVQGKIRFYASRCADMRYCFEICVRNTNSQSAPRARNNMVLCIEARGFEKICVRFHKICVRNTNLENPPCARKNNVFCIEVCGFVKMFQNLCSEHKFTKCPLCKEKYYFVKICVSGTLAD